jgi:hypothetical protein
MPLLWSVQKPGPDNLTANAEIVRAGAEVVNISILAGSCHNQDRLRVSSPKHLKCIQEKFHAFHRSQPGEKENHWPVAN